MKQLLWIGCIESQKEFEIKSKKGYNLASAQISQVNILNGMEEVAKQAFDTMNGSVLPPYPIYEDKYIEEVIWEHAEGTFDINVGYKNFKFINRLACKNAMIKAAKRWLENRYLRGEVIVIVYSMRSSVMATACYIHRKIKHVKIYLIVTDLPQYMDLGESRLKALLKKLDWYQIKWMQKQFDGFILYADKMANYLKIPTDKWMCMEGSYDVAEEINIEPKTIKNRKKAIMYSGKLDEQYGIKMLLESFMEINNPDIELWLTGGGNAEGYIKRCALMDSRIKFYGFFSSREHVLELQRQAALLINMRLPSEEASNYCFPSKLLEYLVTGIPVISFRLGGIPKEYYPHLIIIEEESKQSLKKAIQMGISLQKKEKENLGFEARRFVLKEKNRRVQAQKIWDWIEGNKNSG